MTLPSSTEIDAAVPAGTGTSARSDLLNTVLKGLLGGFASIPGVSTALTALGALSPATDRLPYFSGGSTAALAVFTTLGRSLVAAANQAAARTVLGLGGAALLDVGTTANTVAAGNDARLAAAGSVADGATLPSFFLTPATISSGRALNASDSGKAITVTAAVTIGIPSAATLGTGFSCEIWNDSGGTVTLDGPGSTNMSLLSDEVATVGARNGNIRAAKGVSVVLS